MEGDTRHKRFEYTPLQSPASEIRLVTLNESPETYLLSLTLKTCQLNNATPYIGVSYEWGEVEPQVETLLNEHSFFIRHNLWLFLSVLRAKQRRNRTWKCFPFWVDAICINQLDLDEQNAQVSIMGAIYRQAVSVIAWLGWPEGWNPRITFDFIKSEMSTLYHEPDSCITHTHMFGALPCNQLWQMVLRMCQCRYWSRRWIIQELLLAEAVTLMCGENELTWFALGVFTKQLPNGLRLADLNRTTPFKMARIKAEMPEDGTSVHSILDLLESFKGTECGREHDKIYSLRSLAKDGNSIPVDYKCSLEELLCRVLARIAWRKHEDVWLIADILGLSAKVQRIVSAYTPDYLHEELIATHRILTLGPLLKPGQGMGWWFLTMFRFRHPNHKTVCMILCDDGSVGMACDNAKPDDILCDLSWGGSPGLKFVIRRGKNPAWSIIGTAVLLRGIEPSEDFLNWLIAEAQWDQQYHDFLQLELSPDVSTIADIFVLQERETIRTRIETFQRHAASLKDDSRMIQNVRTCQGGRSLCFKEQRIETQLNAWDLIALLSINHIINKGEAKYDFALRLEESHHRYLVKSYNDIR
jgi:hypothetical protein